MARSGVGPAVDAGVERPGRGCRGEDGSGHQVEANRGEAGCVGRLDIGCVDGREAETGVEFVTADGLWLLGNGRFDFDDEREAADFVDHASDGKAAYA